MRVEAFPSLGLGLLVGPRRNHGVESLCGWTTLLQRHHQARGALWHAVRDLLAGGSARILAPAYHCGVEIEAMLDAGAAVEFYRIDSTLRVDVQDLESRVDSSTRAVVVIHYFGFPQPLQEILKLCRKRGLLLIEDCAHVLPGSREEQALGSFGDLSIFSLPKHFPVPDGGVLCMNRGRLPELRLAGPRTLPVLRPLGRLLLRRLRSGDGRLGRAVERVLDRAVRLTFQPWRRSGGMVQLRELNPGAGEFRRPMTAYGMSRVAERILERIDVPRIAERKRRSYRDLLRRIEGLPGIEPCFDSLPEAVCPMMLPIRVRDRSRVELFLRARGVETFIFGNHLHPTLNPACYQEAAILSKSILALPIHQDLFARRLDAIAGALREAVSGPSGIGGTS